MTFADLQFPKVRNGMMHENRCRSLIPNFTGSSTEAFNKPCNCTPKPYLTVEERLERTECRCPLPKYEFFVVESRVMRGCTYCGDVWVATKGGWYDLLALENEGERHNRRLFEEVVR